jgi:Tfp pilus assembly protein PilV
MNAISTPTLAARLRRDARGFLLMETILAVAIFALGVLALGRCVENAMFATRLKDEDARIRRLLQNRMAEIEVGAVPLGDKSVEDLKGYSKG